MISNLFSSITDCFKNFVIFIKKIPYFVSSGKSNTKKSLQLFYYSMNNLVESNTKLGIHHLYNRNYNDAIFRFKLIDKFLNHGDEKANYFLGWIYFLKNDYKSALVHLNKSGNEDKVQLLSFVKSIDTVTTIPSDIYEMHRDIMSGSFDSKFIDKNNDLPKKLVIELNNHITDLPDKYNILEIGSNLGLLGYELNQRMQKSCYIDSVESSKAMIQMQKSYFPDQKLYNETFNESVAEFFKNRSSKYDIICSLNGFALESNLEKTFNKISNLLKPSAYFAFVVEVSDDSQIVENELCFSYNIDNIIDRLTSAGLKVLCQKQISLEIKNNYSMFICKK